MNALGVIPARFHSTRFEGKILADIFGKPMIQHVWERAKQAKQLDDILVACDDERIYKVVKGFGGNAILTAKEHTSGTERITEAVYALDVKVVVNIQSDEPLIHPTMINDLVENLLADQNLVVATIVKKIEHESEINDPNVVKVVFDKHNFALYFSRSPIPYVRDQAPRPEIYYKHIGLYAYTKDFLFTYKNLAVSSLEGFEKLEQLRILQNGYRIKTVETKFETVGVDTPEDLERAKNALKEQKDGSFN